MLNGGDGAWKEPQAFILFSLYATSVDAVVTLDGFNEYYFLLAGRHRGRISERPDSNFLEVNPFVADENFGDAAIGWVIGRVAGVLSQNAILGHSHAAYMVIRGIESVAKSKDVFKSKKKTTIRGLFEMPEEIRKDHDLAFAVQLSLYQKYERGIEAIAKDNGIKTAYFLQPVPAYGKVLTEEEKKVRGRSGLWRALPPHHRRHDDAQGERPADLRPGRHPEGREGAALRRPHPLHAGSQDRREPGLSHHGRAHGRGSWRDTWGLQKKP